jgi:hypothetical protein
MLYVEATTRRRWRCYQRLGFTRWDVDVMFRKARTGDRRLTGAAAPVHASAPTRCVAAAPRRPDPRIAAPPLLP